MYTVQVKAIGGWTKHSEHASYRDAVDQADMVHGRVVCATGMTDEEAWRFAVTHQDFDGDYTEWMSQTAAERDAYEAGANPAGV